MYTGGKMFNMFVAGFCSAGLLVASMSGNIPMAFLQLSLVGINLYLALGDNKE